MASNAPGAILSWSPRFLNPGGAFLDDGEPTVMRIPSAIPSPLPTALAPGAPPAATTSPEWGEAQRSTPDPAGDGAQGAPPNPTIRVDPMLGLVVLEFRGQRGEVRSIPTERELDAYRAAARGAGPVGAARPDPQAPPAAPDAPEASPDPGGGRGEAAADGPRAPAPPMATQPAPARAGAGATEPVPGAQAEGAAPSR
jgi:hypothetical protein